MIPELLDGTSHGLRNAPTNFLHLHKTFEHRPGAMSRQRPRGQPGTIEIGPVDPREWQAPAAHDGFAGEHSGGIGEGFQPGIEVRVELARNSIQG